MHRWLPEALAAVGRHSLHVFCLGLFLSWGAATAFRLWPAAVAWLDPLAIGAGSAVLIGFAQLLERRRGKQASGHLAFEVARSSEARRLGGAPPRAIPSAPGGRSLTFLGTGASFAWSPGEARARVSYADTVPGFDDTGPASRCSHQASRLDAKPPCGLRLCRLDPPDQRIGRVRAAY